MGFAYPIPCTAAEELGRVKDWVGEFGDGVWVKEERVPMSWVGAVVPCRLSSSFEVESVVGSLFLCRGVHFYNLSCP